MTKTKDQVLNELKEVIEEKGTIQYNYCEGDCFCAVGHLMNICEIDVPILLETFEDFDINSKGIGHILSCFEYDFGLIKSLFTIPELKKLQEINDFTNDDKRTIRLLEYIEELKNE